AEFTIVITQRRIRVGKHFAQLSDHFRRATFQDCLVNLYFQGTGVVGGRMQWREERTSTHQIALSLCNAGLLRKGVDVIRNNIEHMIKLSQRFRETTYYHVRLSMLGEQGSIARIESLSLVEVQLALLPLTSPARDISQRFRNLTAVRQKSTCLF